MRFSTAVSTLSFYIKNQIYLKKSIDEVDEASAGDDGATVKEPAGDASKSSSVCRSESDEQRHSGRASMIWRSESDEVRWGGEGDLGKKI